MYTLMGFQRRTLAPGDKFYVVVHHCVKDIGHCHEKGKGHVYRVLGCCEFHGNRRLEAEKLLRMGSDNPRCGLPSSEHQLTDLRDELGFAKANKFYTAWELIVKDRFGEFPCVSKAVTLLESSGGGAFKTIQPRTDSEDRCVLILEFWVGTGTRHTIARNPSR